MPNRQSAPWARCLGCNGGERSSCAVWEQLYIEDCNPRADIINDTEAFRYCKTVTIHNVALKKSMQSKMIADCEPSISLS